MILYLYNADTKYLYVIITYVFIIYAIHPRHMDILFPKIVINFLIWKIIARKRNYKPDIRSIAISDIKSYYKLIEFEYYAANFFSGPFIIKPQKLLNGFQGFIIQKDQIISHSIKMYP